MISKNRKGRSGLRIRGGRGHPDVRDALVRYAKWLRERYEFPVRVPVYLTQGEFVTTVEGEKVSASFFAPFDRGVEPYIRIATGDFPGLRRDLGRDDSLAAFIVSLSHEVIHYHQWIKTGQTRERGVAKKAVTMLRYYAATVESP